MFSILVHADCNKLRQTSRPVAKAKIPTGCNFEANLCGCIFLLGRFHHRYSDVFSESSHNSMVWLYNYIDLSIDLGLLLCSYCLKIENKRKRNKLSFLCIRIKIINITRNGITIPQRHCLHLAWLAASP